MSTKKSAKKVSNKAAKKAGKKQNSITSHTPDEPVAVIDSPDAAGKPNEKDGAADPQVAGTSNPTDSADPNNSPKESQKKKNAGTSSGKSLPDMKDVIQLATQLVSAQIASHSHHETALNLFNEFRQLALDVADLLRPRTVIKTVTGPEFAPPSNPAPDDPVGPSETPSTTEENINRPDRNFDFDAISRSMSKLANEERLSRLRSRKPRALQPMSHPDLDRLFQSAMRRAFVMLNAPFDMERIVFAEQIFTPHEVLTEGAIRRRFIDFKWTDLKSGDPVIRLMKDVNRWFAKHLKDLGAARQSVEGKETISALDSTIPIKTRIEAEAEKLSWLLNQTTRSDVLAPDELSTYRALESALSKFTNTRNGLDIGGAFRSLDAGERNNLIFVMFGGNGPRDVEPTTGDNGEDGVSDDADTEDSSSRVRYRPRAIFHYLRRFGNNEGDELGMSLNRRLRAKRSELNQTEIPDVSGIEPAEFAFGPLHEELDDFLAREETLGQSDIAEDSDELAAYVGDRSNLTGLSTELRNDVTDSNGIIPF